MPARVTIPPQVPSTARQAFEEAGTLALSALGWVLSDGDRAERFLALTGLTPEALRGGLADPAMQAAVLDFLCAHEPDLIAAADMLGLAPQELAAARERLAP